MTRARASSNGQLERAVHAASRQGHCEGTARASARATRAGGLPPQHRSRLERACRRDPLRERATEVRFHRTRGVRAPDLLFLRAGGLDALHTAKRGRNALGGNTGSRAGRMAADPAPNPRSGSERRGLPRCEQGVRGVNRRGSAKLRGRNVPGEANPGTADSNTHVVEGTDEPQEGRSGSADHGPASRAVLNGDQACGRGSGPSGPDRPDSGRPRGRGNGEEDAANQCAATQSGTNSERRVEHEGRPEGGNTRRTSARNENPWRGERTQEPPTQLPEIGRAHV